MVLLHASETFTLEGGGGGGKGSYIDKGEQLSVTTGTTGNASRDTREGMSEVVMKAGSLELNFEIQK